MADESKQTQHTDKQGRQTVSTEVFPEVPEPKTHNPYGMTAEQARVATAIGTAMKSQPFSVGQFCERAGLNGDECLAVFNQLHSIGVLRCPVNDGGCALFQLVPDLVRRYGAL